MLMLLVSGCATGIAPRVISQERMDYNQFITRSQNEQLLLNLVRLRYQDPPMFLELNTVLASYSLGFNASGGASFNSSKQQSGNIGGGLSFSTSPTVNYSPLQGEAFAKRMLSPIAPEMLVLLLRSGWSVERLMHVCVERINSFENAPLLTTDSTQTATPFGQLLDNLRSLQKLGPKVLSFYLASSNGSPRLFLALPEDLPQAERSLMVSVRQQLELGNQLREFRLTSSQVRSSTDEIAIQGRSLLSVLFFLSHTVEVPASHQKSGLVKMRKDTLDKPVDHPLLTNEIMAIHAKGTPPGNAFVSIHYRGCWYYIADNDPDSKTTFSLLTYLFSLQAAQGSGGAPLLTLPLGR